MFQLSLKSLSQARLALLYSRGESPEARVWKLPADGTGEDPGALAPVARPRSLRDTLASSSCADFP